jgi:hypothetical protein
VVLVLDRRRRPQIFATYLGAPGDNAATACLRLSLRVTSTSSPLIAQARTDRFSGEQLAGNAPVILRVPLDGHVVERDEPRHDAEHGPASIKQQFLDLYGIGRRYCREPCRDDRLVGVGLERGDHPIEDPLHQSAQHSWLLPARLPDLDSDGESRLGDARRRGHLDLVARER